MRTIYKHREGDANLRDKEILERFLVFGMKSPAGTYGALRARCEKPVVAVMKVSKGESSMTAHVCGIDIGKTVFNLIGLNKDGHVVVKKRFSRKQLITDTVNMPACLVGMEACPGPTLGCDDTSQSAEPARSLRK